MGKKKYGVFYHGTCADHLDDILVNGIQPVPTSKRLWCDSMYTRVYLWGHDACIAAGDRGAKQLALESAEYALGRADDCRILVIEARVPLTEIWEDTSCEHMDGAFEAMEIPTKWITKIEISQDLSLFKGYFFNLLASRDKSNIYEETMSCEEKAVMKMLRKNEFFFSDNVDINLTKVYEDTKRTSRARVERSAGPSV